MERPILQQRSYSEHDRRQLSPLEKCRPQSILDESDVIEVLCACDQVSGKRPIYILMIKTISGHALVAKERFTAFREAAKLIEEKLTPSTAFPKTFAKTKLGIALTEAEVNDRTTAMETYFDEVYRSTYEHLPVKDRAHFCNAIHFAPVTTLDKARRLSSLVIAKVATANDVATATTPDVVIQPTFGGTPKKRRPFDACFLSDDDPTLLNSLDDGCCFWSSKVLLEAVGS